MSWDLGFLVMGVLGIGMGLLAQWSKSRTTRYILLGAMPFVCAWALYWIPASSGGSSSEYASWAPVFVFPWAVAAYVSAVLGFLLARWLSKRRRAE